MGAVRVDRLLDIIDPSALSGLGSQRITEEQYREIGAFTTTLVSSATSATDKYLKIFRWLCDNVTYNFSDNSPYALFPSHESLDLRYEHSQLTVSDVKPVRGPELVVPYSIKGVQITNFNPRTILSSVTDLYLGENIQNLGRPDLMRLSEAGLTVANIFIAPE